MARLPTVGADSGNWGTILNEFLNQEHNPDGTHGTINPTDIKAKGPWVDVRNYASINDAITFIGKNNADLLIPNPQNITSYLNIPENVTLWFLRDGKITVGNRLTLTINGQVNADRHTIFSWTGTGNIKFNRYATLYPEWFGADPNGVNDSIPAFNMIIDHAIDSEKGAFVILSPGAKYYVTDMVWLHASNTTWWGYGAWIYSDRDTSGGGTFIVGGTDKNHLVRHVRVFGVHVSNSQTNHDENALGVAWGEDVIFRDCWVDAAERKGFSVHYSSDVWVTNCVFKNCKFAGMDVYNEDPPSYKDYNMCNDIHYLFNIIEVCPGYNGLDGWGIVTSTNIGTVKIKGLEIRGNIIRTTNREPILVQNADSPIIADNIVETSSPNAGAAIETAGCINEQIRGNKILKAYQTGIVVLQTEGTYQITGNTIESWAGPANRRAIYVYNPSKVGVITDNQIPATNTEGYILVVATDTTTPVISGNVMVGTASEAFGEITLGGTNLAGKGVNNIFGVPFGTIVQPVHVSDNTGTTGEVNIISYTFKAKSLGKTRGWRLNLRGYSEGTAGDKTIKIKFGGTTVRTIVIPASNTDQWWIDGQMRNNNVTGQQRGGSTFTLGNDSTGNYDWSNEDSTVDKIFSVAIQLANSADSIIITGGYLETIY